MPKRRLTPLITATLAALILLTSLWQVAGAASPAYEEDLVRRVQTMFGSDDAMAAGAEPALPIRCGTPLANEIRAAWPGLSPDARRRIAEVLPVARPELPEHYDFSTSAGDFRIHYDSTGGDSVDMSFGVGEGDVPVYILRCAAYVDSTVIKEVVELGYIFPVSDAAAGGGNDRYDVYFLDIGSQFYGLTYWESQIARPGPDALTSWIVLNSDYKQIGGYAQRPFEAMAVSVAHEFHHAIQWSYDGFEAEANVVDDTLIVANSWFYELTATSIEDVVFDYVNDYYLLTPFFFEAPWLSLRTPPGTTYEGLHPYASAIWGHFLAEKFGHSLMLDVWEECGRVEGNNTFDAFEVALASRGSSLADAWAEFLVWNYFTGSRAASWSYDEGAEFGSFAGHGGEIADSLIALYSEYPLIDTTSPYPEGSTGLVTVPYSTDEFAGTYLRFIPGASDSITSLNLLLSADEPNAWMVVTAGLQGNLAPEIDYRLGVFAAIEVPNWDRFDEILVIVSPFESDPSQQFIRRNVSFSFEVADSFSTNQGSSVIAKVYSNPLRLTAAGGEEPFQIDVALAEPTPVSMYVYTPSGQLIKGGPEDGMFVAAGPRTAKLRWAGTNRENQRVASGVYLALVKIGDKSEVIKVAVINK